MSTPEQELEALSAGAFTVIVGTAINKPEAITKRFVRALGAKVGEEPGDAPGAGATRQKKSK